MNLEKFINLSKNVYNQQMPMTTFKKVRKEVIIVKLVNLLIIVI